MNAAELKSVILRLAPNFTRFIDQPIKATPESDALGWHSHVQISTGHYISSGTHVNRETARRIAISELLERKFLMGIGDREEIERLMLDQIPSSSGFAAGFSREATCFRSVCEGLERWAWSKWIDDGHFLPRVKVEPIEISDLAAQLSKSFERVEFLKLSFEPIKDLLPVKLDFGVTLGFLGDGVFAGSRVASFKDDLWTHGIVEAYRNLENFKLGVKAVNSKNEWYMDRLNYFGNNSRAALAQIPGPKPETWPIPIVQILEEAKTSVKGLYLWRCLFKEFKPWHLGDHTRFVY